jgi:heterodisulfide reductase subunit B2
MNVGYYPGCALHGSSNDYEQSLRTCLGGLDVELQEVPDWICCGATAAHALNHKLSLALPARNLALAERQKLDQVFAPCPLCSMQLMKAKQALGDDAVRQEMSRLVEIDLEGRSEVLNLIQILQNVGLDRLKSAVTEPQKDVVAACYYGCLLTRPPSVVHFDDFEQPQSMEAIVGILGAKAVDWNYKTECCGAGMTMADEDTVLELSHKILQDAADHGANCLVVACPMCHVNLDMKQAAVEQRYGTKLNLVIYYLSDLVGLAMGFPAERLGINRHFVTKA